VTDGQTDRQTDGRTDGIAVAYTRYSMLSRVKTKHILLRRFEPYGDTKCLRDIPLSSFTYVSSKSV